ncbi:hypothetical protein [Actinopolymorpha pittospori]
MSASGAKPVPPGAPCSSPESAADLEQAWTVHARMYAAEMRALSQADRARLETAYVRALKKGTIDPRASVDTAAVLYAFDTSGP